MATSVLPDVATRPRLGSFVPARVNLQRVALVGMLALYVFSVSPHWFVLSDSALYLMLGQNLAAGQGYTLWGVPHAHVPPGYSAFLAVMMQLGLSSYFWLNLSTTLMTLSVLWLSYKYMADKMGASFALLVCLTLGFAHEMHMASVLLLSDVFFMLAVWIGIYCYGRGLKQSSGYWLELGTLALIGCCWIRVAGFPLAGAAALGLLLEPREGATRRRVWLNSAALLAGVGLTAIGFYKYHQYVAATYPVHTYGGYVGTMAARSQWEWLFQPPLNFMGSGRGVLRILTGQQHNVLPVWGVAMVWIPIAIGMALAVRRRQFLCLSCMVGYLGVLTVNEPLMARYLLPLAPLLIWYFFDGMRTLATWFKPTRGLAPKVGLALLLILLAFNLPRSIGYTYFVHEPETYKLYPQWQAMRQAASFLKQHGRTDERFLTTDNQRQLSYLSGMDPARLSSYQLDLSWPVREDYDHWLSKNTTFVIKWYGMRPDAEELFDTVCREKGFRTVYANQFCEIYSTRPLRKVHAVARKVSTICQYGQCDDDGPPVELANLRLDDLQN